MNPGVVCQLGTLRLIQKIAQAQVSKKLIGTTGDGTKVVLVEGGEIRDLIDVEYGLGAHSLCRPYVPDGEIWIERLPSVSDMEANLAHELVEYFLMKYTGMAYREAHAHAQEVEKKYRRLSKTAALEKRAINFAGLLRGAGKGLLALPRAMGRKLWSGPVGQRVRAAQRYFGLRPSIPASRRNLTVTYHDLLSRINERGLPAWYDPKPLKYMGEPIVGGPGSLGRTLVDPVAGKAQLSGGRMLKSWAQIPGSGPTIHPAAPRPAIPPPEILGFAPTLRAPIPNTLPRGGSGLFASSTSRPGLDTFGFPQGGLVPGSLEHTTAAQQIKAEFLRLQKEMASSPIIMAPGAHSPETIRLLQGTGRQILPPPPASTIGSSPGRISFPLATAPR